MGAVQQTALHLGALHPVEQGLVLLIAFGPFVALGIVVRYQRRRDAHEQQDEDVTR